MRPLPVDIYGEIAENLYNTSSRQTLLSLALVNKAWSIESQRVLFRRFCHLGYTREHQTVYTRIHIRFLEAIISQPKRLGGYVRAYAQCGLAVDQRILKREEVQYWTVEILLWGLTVNALPAMINLKRLTFAPTPHRYNSMSFAAEALLRRCTFQLETLSWRCDGDLSELCTVFLPTQSGLKHLEVGQDPGETDLSELPEDACPSLLSVTLWFGSMCHVAEKRNIKALQMHKKLYYRWRPTIPLDCHSSALDRLEYLSVWSYKLLRRFMGTNPLNVTLLELRFWTRNVVLKLSDLPQLRVLSLLECQDAPDYQELTHGDIAVKCFSRLPTLKIVIIQDRVLSGGMHWCEKYIVNRRASEIHPLRDMTCSHLAIEYRPDTVWWTVYEDMDSWRPVLDLDIDSTYL